MNFDTCWPLGMTRNLAMSSLIPGCRIKLFNLSKWNAVTTKLTKKTVRHFLFLDFSQQKLANWEIIFLIFAYYLSDTITTSSNIKLYILWKRMAYCYWKFLFVIDLSHVYSIGLWVHECLCNLFQVCFSKSILTGYDNNENDNTWNIKWDILLQIIHNAMTVQYCRQSYSRKWVNNYK